jgi:peptide/nickel transport system substrate-binding protein
MTIRALIGGCALFLLAAGCGREETGPVAVSAIGGPPRLVDPNLAPVDPPSAFLLDAAAQGLVRFNAAGEIEPALAQSWYVSDDGLRYTFRIRRTEWAGGGRVTAQQVTARLRAPMARASRNPLKAIFGLVVSVEPMTDQVLEFTLKAPRPHFLELLAQPEMAILRGANGSGPRRAEAQPDGSVLLSLPPPEEDERPDPSEAPVAIRGESAPYAVARFLAGGTDLVLGGTAGDLPVVRAAQPPAASLQFDPVAGLFGLVFIRAEGALGEAPVRRALSMALDRDAIAAALAVPGLVPRLSLLPAGLQEVPQPALPDWSEAALLVRRQEAARTLSSDEGAEPLRLRIAMPEGPGYRLLFAYLKRDWRAVGVEAERVAPDMEADLAFVDLVAPASMTAWYLRNFTCDRVRVCSPEADEALALARETLDMDERRALLAQADSLMRDAALFVPIAAPVRWNLVSPRMTGFRRNAFGRHTAGELVARGN